MNKNDNFDKFLKNKKNACNSCQYIVKHFEWITKHSWWHQLMTEPTFLPIKYFIFVSKSIKIEVKDVNDIKAYLWNVLLKNPNQRKSDGVYNIE